MDLNALQPDCSGLPEELRALVEQAWGRFSEAAGDCVTHLDAECTLPEAFASELARVWAGSDFVVDTCCRDPACLFDLLISGDLFRAYEPDEYARRIGALLDDVDDDAGLRGVLRRVRRREMLRIVWRDFSRRADFFETVYGMSGLADAAIQHAESWLYRAACERWGTPCSVDGTPQRLVVLGLGKLGAWELNVSSDVDLMFFYPEPGETRGGRRALANHEFFGRLGQELIGALNQQDADGFVFRVDMRLRPYGQSGALVMHFDAAEEYYQDHGRDWERYAMIKARVVAGDLERGRAFLAGLRPFVYRKYLDYSAFDSLRVMKDLINQEVRRKGLQADVKLGRGGIREVEFIVQSFQLIRGGRDTRLQDTRLWPVLELLEAEELLPAGAAGDLREAYLFLRNTEHAIQGMADRQTQALPRDELGIRRVAWIMGYSEPDPFLADLEAHRGRVNLHFERIIDIDMDATGPGSRRRPAESWTGLWMGTLTGGEATRLLEKHGFAEPEAALESLRELRSEDLTQRLQAVSLQRLDESLPLLLETLANAAPEVDRTRTLGRILPLVRGVVRRSAYLLLLIENPGAMDHLVRLCAASPWIAAELADTPSLLDELLNAETLYSPPDREELQEELGQQLLRIPQDDIEQQMECLRYFKDAHVLRVAASEIAGTLPLMKVSDYLTFIAEVVLQHVLELAWQYLIEKHGRPGTSGGEAPDFLILAYGKLGGIELGYGSDLDLVFIHDADHQAVSEGDRDGRRQIDNATYFTRLAQRLIHLLGTRTASGILYEVDVRLRPSGASGLLVSSLKGFEEYQLDSAWTWEHQALVRARVVAGGRALTERFEALRARILSRERDLERLQAQVREMRGKMREALGTRAGQISADAMFDLKQDEGAIVDIEFMVQYAVLAWSHACPELLRYTDNIRILENLAAAGLLAPEDAELLTEAYKAYRSAAHRQALQNAPASVSVEEFQEYRAAVSRLWRRLIEEPPCAPG